MIFYVQNIIYVIKILILMTLFNKNNTENEVHFF